jgi:UPF0755 protein
MNLRKIALRLALASLAFAGLGLGGAYAYLQYYLDTPLALPAEQLIEVTPGSSLQQVARRLEQEVGLAHPRLFSYWARSEGFDRAIRAGEFIISPGMSPRTALQHLLTGPLVQYPFTFIEGTTVRSALEALWESPKLTITLQQSSDEEILAAIGSEFPSLEGALFPDTYFYTAGTTDQALLRRASARLQVLLEQEWETRSVSLPYASPYESLILASIIEKETGLLSERETIAGVFVRRLQRGMRLQSDPTVIYGMGKDYNGNIRRVDLETTTAYNTYRISGLPPTPIAMTGRGAIHASLHPSDESYLYFVATGDGGHQFSTTLAEHNAAVKLYQSRTATQQSTN